MACVIGLMTFASCDPEIMEQMMEQKPEIELVEAEGYISHNIGVRLGDELFFEVTVAPNSGSMSELTNVDFTVKKENGTVIFADAGEIEDPNDENTIDFSFEPEEAAAYVVTITVTDAANKSSEVKVAVAVSEPVESVYGIYTGLLDINGYVSSNEIVGYEGYNHKEFEVKDIPVTLTLGEMDDEGNILIGVDVEDSYVTVMGTWEDGTVTIGGVYFYRAISLFVRVNVEFTIDITGVIDDNIMVLSGTASGSGSAQVVTTKLEVTFEDGTLDGVLVEVVE